MKIAIDIPEDYMPWIENNLGYIPDKISREIGTRILNGTVLPKGHGRWIVWNEESGESVCRVYDAEIDDRPMVLVEDTGVET